MRTSSESVRFIRSVSWSVFPLGQLRGYLSGSVSVEVPSVVYDIADVISRREQPGYNFSLPAPLRFAVETHAPLRSAAFWTSVAPAASAASA